MTDKNTHAPVDSSIGAFFKKKGIDLMYQNNKNITENVENKRDINKLFYCYSDRLNEFLHSLRINYVDKGFNPSNGKNCRSYDRDETLEKALIYWNQLKKDYNGLFINPFYYWYETIKNIKLKKFLHERWVSLR